MESKTVMQKEDQQKLDYPYPEFTAIRPDYLRLVDSTLQTTYESIQERMDTLLSLNQCDVQARPSSTEALRMSPLGQALLTIADSVSNGRVPMEKVNDAIERVHQILFGNLLSDDYLIPDWFETTDLGMLLQDAIAQMYRPEELMTPVQVYKSLGITRESLYRRLEKGKLTRIRLHGERRFVRSEIETWKTQREQQTSIKDQEA